MGFPLRVASGLCSGCHCHDPNPVNNRGRAEEREGGGGHQIGLKGDNADSNF